MDIKAITDLNPSPRILLGPGPSMASPRVLRVMSTPLVGHLDPAVPDPDERGAEHAALRLPDRERD